MSFFVLTTDFQEKCYEKSSFTDQISNTSSKVKVKFYVIERDISIFKFSIIVCFNLGLDFWTLDIFIRFLAVNNSRFWKISFEWRRIERRRVATERCELYLHLIYYMIVLHTKPHTEYLYCLKLQLMFWFQDVGVWEIINVFPRPCMQCYLLYLSFMTQSTVYVHQKVW